MDNPPPANYNPDEIVTLTGSKGTVKRVPRSQLPKFGLPLDYQSQADIYAKSVQAGNADAGTIPEKYRAGALTSLGDVNYVKGKKEIGDTAAKVLDVISKKDTYKNPQDYQDALNYAASDYNTRGFGQGGKNLTGTEKQILSGTLINQGKQGQNLLQRGTGIATGYTPPEKGVVADPEDTIRNKMIAALKAAGQDTSKYEKAATTAAQPSSSAASAQELPSIGGFVGNVLTDTKNIANGLLNIPGAAVRATLANPGIPPQNLLLNELPNIASNYVNNLNQDLGKPLEGGDIVGKMAQNVYQRPVGTALDVLPFIGAAGKAAGIGKAGKAGEIADTATTSRSLDLPVINGLKGIGNDLAGRAATSLAAPDPESVVHSEALMKQVLQATKANTPRGLARETESIIPKAGLVIDNNVGSLDKQIGLQPRDEIIADVIAKLEKTSEAQANPQLLNDVRVKLENELGKEQMPNPGPGKGELYGTSQTQINAARKRLNSEVGKWFDAGTPVGTPTNDLNSLKWQASEVLKDILKEGDHQGQISQALDLQHAAIQSRAPLSKAALSSSGSQAGAVRTILNLLKRAVSPAQVMGARALQGSGNPVTQEVRNTLPPIQ